MAAVGVSPRPGPSHLRKTSAERRPMVTVTSHQMTMRLGIARGLGAGGLAFTPGRGGAGSST